MGTIRCADLVCVVVETAESTLEQIESVLPILNARNLSLQSVGRNTLDPADPARRAGLIVLNKAALAGPAISKAIRELYARSLDVLSVSALTGQGVLSPACRTMRSAKAICPAAKAC
jgi:hypothetical protein